MDDLSPTEFYLFQNYPNPFTEKTTIKYCIAYKTKVKITVYNSKGKMIEKVVDEEKEAGTYKIEFNLAVRKDLFANGNLLYRLEAGNYTSNKQMMLEK
jgi:2-oxo-4-hydroxy-4-carboxy--5-ureidoimidazoline (OHCU) decarboxylase